MWRLGGLVCCGGVVGVGCVVGFSLAYACNYAIVCIGGCCLFSAGLVCYVCVNFWVEKRELPFVCRGGSSLLVGCYFASGQVG